MAIYKYLSALGISVAVMNGDTSLKERNDYINKFVLGDIKVLVTNVQKGLDFNNCNHCIFYDYDPSSSKMVQFEGRMAKIAPSSFKSNVTRFIKSFNLGVVSGFVSILYPAELK